ncbi:MAG: hypothetical protein NTZ50_05450 [Chloroflexi bacterium]|nr:hypothetical protein [Chloroflexota bacterium]
MTRKPTNLELNVYEALHQLFSKEEIASIAWELRIDVEDLNTTTKQSMSRELIEYAAACGRTNQLAQLVLRERPHARVYVLRPASHDD